MFLEAFWRRVSVGAPDECWPWTGDSIAHGYGIVLTRGSRKGRVRVPAHRLMLELHDRQPVPEGMVVCHRCDNPPCCNPAHLFVGTYQDNTDDMISKGRAAFRPRMLTVRGVTMTAGAWGRRVGISKELIYFRLRKGLSAEEAVSPHRMTKADAGKIGGSHPKPMLRREARNRPVGAEPQ